MSTRRALLAATVLILPLAARAEPVAGLYVGAGAGINVMQTEDATITILGFNSNGGLKTNPGPVAVLSLGWGFGNGLRTEVEGSFRSNQFSGTNNSATSASGTERKFGAMVNAFYDLSIVPWMTPYFGAGIGYQAANLQGATLANTVGVITTPVAGPAIVTNVSRSVRVNNSTQGSFAYQAIAGVSIPIESQPGLAITGEYRFLGLAGNRTYGGTQTVTGFGSTPITFRSTSNFNHSIVIGIRYNFGQSSTVVETQAATPAQPAAMARSYLVFFDWDKATLTDRARGIIRDAATNSTKVAYTKIDVNGYTDTSGTPTYNQGLSVRRAQAVAAELVKDGVPKGAIAISGFGDTHLLVPTGPGVREPQNRRVEIIIH